MNGSKWPNRQDHGGKPRRRQGTTRYQPARVEISTRVHPGATEECLLGLVASSRGELLRMGAAAAEIEVVTDRDEDGAVSVMVTWINATVADQPAPVEDGR